MKKFRALGRVVFLSSILALLAEHSSQIAAQTRISPTYTREQAAQGQVTYGQQCASCHGPNLDDGQFAAPLKGSAFRQQWGAKSVEALFAHMSTRMPPGSPGSLGDDAYLAVLAYMLQQNGVPPGTRALPSDPDALTAMVLPASAGGGFALTAGISFPPAPLRPNPLDKLTPVTEAVLNNPPEADWLTWRRTPDVQGFSPLKQITKDNVGDLRVAWTWSLPNGPHEATPLVHDGVLFVRSNGDKVQALDAATGDRLWQYTGRLPKDAPVMRKRNIALYGDRVYVPASDTHIVALDSKTGKVVWDHQVVDTKQPGTDFRIDSMLAAKGKIMAGTVGQRTFGGNFIVALDAKTGEEAWRFYTIARPGDPADSWNGLPVEKREGGSVWVAGSYDPALNLAFFGPAPTYDTGPLRKRASGAVRNDALYTNATIALNPDSGKLVWYFQHRPNDQWDLDWAFERHLIKLPVNGTPRTVVVTGGKEAIFDTVEAEHGRYIFSMDLGLQNFVTAIDPRTGAKTIDQKRVPGDGETKFVCPSMGGAKSWLPSSYNPATNILYVPLVESCMDLTPVAEGERGHLSTGVHFSMRPRLDSDGKFGRVEAINLATRKVAWVHRQRAPISAGTLATAGGVVFTGAIDRVFAAYDDATGKELWRIRLNDVPNSAPISYTVNGKQYVAITVGNGGNQALNFAQFVPDIVNPPEPGATLWVFELPDRTRASGRVSR